MLKNTFPGSTYLFLANLHIFRLNGLNKESDVRCHNQNTCLIRRMPPSSWYLSGERQRKYRGTKVKQKILQHFHFQSLSLLLSFEASAQPKMAFLLNKTSIASHFRSHSQVLRTSSLLDPFPSSFRSSNPSLSFSLSLSLSRTQWTRSLTLAALTTSNSGLARKP